ncbi:GDSL esterase/lipase LIP-4-like [Musa acuminata AAA Group]|uniref:GDSL esterase/lipase LIP-4-like n=1 Tax=Musa acuminata AAA Group TaxID=214697 RepID=UPI0031DBF962
MGGAAGRPPLTGLLPLTLLLLLPALPMETAHETRLRRRPVIFNFGDSNSDTGGLAAGLGLLLAQQEGRAFFHRPSGRLCDGRLVIDFLCESLHSSYLSPYMESLGSDFRNGANFAVIGSCTRPPNVPFSLAVQVQQFLRFKLRSLELVAQGAKGLTDAEGFQNALYAIDIGQNDLAAAFSANLTYAKVIRKIPSVIHEIKKAIKNLYDNGGKNFWVHNTGPLGCLPQKLALPRKNDSRLDPYGCLIPFNNAAKEFNAQLSALCDELNSKLKNATIVYTDIYSIKYDLIANFTKYGFETALMACCGYGGPPYNFNQTMECGSFGSQVCPLGSKYISWDGVHYTEAANAIVASKILTTKYSKPNLAFDYFCTA